MEFYFKKDLSVQDLEEFDQFYSSLELVTIEQHPRWNDVSQRGGDVLFAFAKKDGKIISFALVVEKRYPFLKTAYISFGPLFRDPDVLVEMLIQIHQHYVKAGFGYMYVQLAVPVNSISEYIEYKVNRQLKVKYLFDRNNWSSLQIDLTKSVDDIFRNFSKGHKSAIKKSVTDGVVVRKIESEEQIVEFGRIFVKMQTARNLLTSTAEQSVDLIKRMHEFLTKANLGFGLVVFDKNQVMVGGIIVIYQGRTARYFKGASDPERKDVASLHTAIFEAIKITKESGRTLFDLWGYNHMVGEEDQIFYVNRFKKGFSDQYSFYPKIMHMSLTRSGFFLYRTLMANRHRLGFLKRMLKRERRSGLDT